MSYFTSLRSYAAAHKLVSTVAVLVLLLLCWWLWGKAHSASAAPRYVVGEVERGTVVSTVSASGQVSAQTQVDLKPKASGDITYVGIKAGQKVAKGQLLVRLDSGNAAYQLQSSQLSYQKLVTVDPQDLINAQNAVADAQASQVSAYTSARAALTKASSDMQDVLDGLHDLYAGYLSSQSVAGTGAGDMRTQGERDSDKAQSALEDFNKSSRALSASASNDEVEVLMANGYATALQVSNAAKEAQDTVVFLRNNSNKNTATGDAAYASATSLAQKANSVVSAITSAQGSVSGDKASLEKAQAALEMLQSGPNELDRRSAQLDVEQKKEALADYSVYAPFAGTIATVDAQVGQQGSSGTAVATIVSPGQVADISLNEVDAAKIKEGQKATLTFDAIDGLTLTGTVAEVDGIGTVSQGVVSYGVEIALDAQDSRIKPGMTVNAEIQTATAQDVLVVPTSAVKTSGGQSYVLAFDPPLATSSAAASAQGVESSQTPVQVPVEVGIADDTNVEITSGLAEGRQIVTRTISSSAAATTGSTATRAGGTAAARPGGGANATFRAL